jgi:hypothetical protein
VTTATELRTARRHYGLSALIANRAAREARKARRRNAGSAAIATVVLTHQVAAAQEAEISVGDMLAEQEIDSIADALLEVLSFTTDPATLTRMIEKVDTDWEFDRLVESIVQDAARAAESVATAVRPNIWHMRFVSTPCCPRCAVLAGRLYRYSEGFLRHPNCRCTMVPTTVAGEPQDPDDLVRQGLVRGLSEADRRALADGADLGRVVNVRLQKAGLTESGRVLARRGKPTPEGIYRMAADRTQALELLREHGYIH